MLFNPIHWCRRCPTLIVTRRIVTFLRFDILPLTFYIVPVITSFDCFAEKSSDWTNEIMFPSIVTNMIRLTTSFWISVVTIVSTSTFKRSSWWSSITRVIYSSLASLSIIKINRISYLVVINNISLPYKNLKVEMKWIIRKR